LLRRAAPLHDVGKIGIPDAILLKPGKLTPEEFELMKTHTTIGAEILSGGRSPLVRLAQNIALTHQERWDGSGYPRGLAGEAIPLEGRIVALVDVLDALTHERPYKLAWPLDEAVAEIARQSGRQFDPRLVAVFLQLYAEGRLADLSAVPEH
jgi:putative two-component system response regulator